MQQIINEQYKNPKVLRKLTAFGTEHHKEVDAVKKTKAASQIKFHSIPVCLCDSVQTEIFEKKRRLTDYREKRVLNVRQRRWRMSTKRDTTVLL